MQSRRILLTGLSTFWGGRLAQRLERDPAVETVIGVDTDYPTRELERTEFVRVSNQHALIRRIVAAAEIDTVIDTRLTVDSSVASPRVAHENNVIGTMNILAACSGPDSPVRKVVFKSSSHWYGCEQDDPAFFTEEMSRPHPPRTPIEKDIVEAESAVEDFRSKNPDVTVCMLRFVNSLGPGLTTSHTRLFSALPVLPAILGFDPRYQFIHEDDIVGALEHAAGNDLDGIFNAGGDGVLVLSEVAALLGKPMAPVLPPWGTGIVAGQARRLGMRIPTELLNQLRYGRGVDNRRLKATGYDYRYTSREAVQRFAEHLRIRPLLSSAREPYRYEQEVEEFLRWSPSVQVTNERAGKRWRPSERELSELERAIAVVRAEEDEGGDDGSQVNRPPGARPAAEPDRAPREPGYGALSASEVIDLLPSLDPRDVRRLRDVEAAHQGRKEVLAAIDRILGEVRPSQPVPGQGA
jgi:UDP-glucose 4-epimerase